MLDAVNRMMINMVVAIARKGYEQRRERQAQGIEKAKQKGVYKGRPADQDKLDRNRELLSSGFSIRKAEKMAGAAPSTVQKVKRKIDGAHA